MSETGEQTGPGGRAATAATLHAAGGTALTAAGAALGYAVRYGFVEPSSFGAACEGGGPWWCGARTSLIVMTQMNGFGWLSLAFAVLALGALALRATVAARALAFPAALLAGLGLYLYNTTMSAPAAILAVLVLIGAARLAREG